MRCPTHQLIVSESVRTAPFPNHLQTDANRSAESSLSYQSFSIHQSHQPQSLWQNPAPHGAQQAPLRRASISRQTTLCVWPGDSMLFQLEMSGVASLWMWSFLMVHWTTTGCPCTPNRWGSPSGRKRRCPQLGKNEWQWIHIKRVKHEHACTLIQFAWPADDTYYSGIY